MRESLGTRLGFIFMAAGCAIGLGNVWRFPYIVGRNGGAAFVFVYLLFLLFLAMPILIMEFSVGRASQQSNIKSFEKLQPSGTRWSLWGYGGLAGNYILMMFYTTVTGWMIAYMWYYLTGSISELKTPGEVGGFFGGMLSNWQEMGKWLLITIGFGAAVCAGGLQKGVERVTKIMMSCLFVILIGLVIYSLTLKGAGAGIEFYLKPDWAKLTPRSMYDALGQAFFTLSVGIGSMAIFGSYIGRQRSLTGEALIVTGLDTLVSFSAGLIIFSVCFTYGTEPGAGPGLIFVTLPNLFNNMPYSRFIGTIFFVFMSFAAITTVIAVFELIIANFIDNWGWSRVKSSFATFVIISITSIPCLLGFNEWSSFKPFGGESAVIDLLDFILSNNLLPIGALIYLLFCVDRYGWGWENFIAEANAGEGMKFASWLRPYFTYIVPAAILIILAMGYVDFIKGLLN